MMFPCLRCQDRYDPARHVPGQALARVAFTRHGHETLSRFPYVGLAIGFTTSTPGDIAGTLGSGTSVWSAISILIALVVGGWAAARTAAAPGRANGALNGAMVWVATTLLVLAFLGSGIATLAAVADNIVATGMQLAAPLTGRAAANAPELFYA